MFPPTAGDLMFDEHVRIFEAGNPMPKIAKAVFGAKKEIPAQLW